MFVVTLRVHPSDSQELTRRLQASLAPILKGNPGFRGYHSIQADDGVRMGIIMFESRADAEAFRDESHAFVNEQIVPLCGEPEVVAGDVLFSMRPDGVSGQAAAASAPETRPH